MDYREAAALLRERDQFLIITHRRPDGDTIGCAVGLCAALRGLGKTAWVLRNEDATNLFLPYLEGYVAPGGFTPQFVVTTDIAGLSLFTPEGEAWLARGVDLAIDHHPSYEGFAAQSCVDHTRAACGELVYDIVRLLGPVTAEIALPLYMAVSTDTGCFLYGNTTSATHRVAADLMDTGINAAALNKWHFRSKSLTRLRLEGQVLEEMTLLDGGAIAIASVTRAMTARLGAAEEDTEGLASFLGQIEGVEVSVTIRELEDGTCKLSVRTTGGLNATRVCALLGGGGHAAAAGCTIQGSPDHAAREIVRAIRAVQHG